MSILNGSTFGALIKQLNNFLKGLNKFSKINAIFNVASLINGFKTIINVLVGSSKTGFSEIYRSYLDFQKMMTSAAIAEAKARGIKAGQTEAAAQKEGLTEGGTEVPLKDQATMMKYAQFANIAGMLGGAFSLAGLLTSNKSPVAGSVLSAVGNTASFAAMGTKIGAVFGPGGLVGGAIIGGLVGLIPGITDVFKSINQIAEEKLKDLQEKSEELNIERAQKKEDYKNLQSLLDKYEELRVNKGLSEEAYQEWIDVNNQLVEAYPELIGYIDEEVGAIADVTNASEILALKMQDAAAAAGEYYRNKVAELEQEYNTIREERVSGKSIQAVYAPRSQQISGKTPYDTFENFNEAAKLQANFLKDNSKLFGDDLLSFFTNAQNFDAGDLFDYIKDNNINYSQALIERNKKGEFDTTLSAEAIFLESIGAFEYNNGEYSYSEWFKRLLSLDSLLNKTESFKKASALSTLSLLSSYNKEDNSIEDISGFQGLIYTRALNQGLTADQIVDLTEVEYVDLIQPYLDFYSSLSSANKQIFDSLYDQLDTIGETELIDLLTDEEGLGLKTGSEIYKDIISEWQQKQSDLRARYIEQWNELKGISEEDTFFFDDSVEFISTDNDEKIKDFLQNRSTMFAESFLQYYNEEKSLIEQLRIDGNSAQASFTENRLNTILNIISKIQDENSVLFKALNEEQQNQLLELLFSNDIGTYDWAEQLNHFFKENSITYSDAGVDEESGFEAYAFENFNTRLNTYFEFITKYEEEIKKLSDNQEKGFSIEEANKLLAQIQKIDPSQTFLDTFYRTQDGVIQLRDFYSTLQKLYEDQTFESLESDIFKAGEVLSKLTFSDLIELKKDSNSIKELSSKLTSEYGIDEEISDSFADFIFNFQGEDNAIKSALLDYFLNLFQIPFNFAKNYKETLEEETTKEDAIKQLINRAQAQRPSKLTSRGEGYQKILQQGLKGYDETLAAEIAHLFGTEIETLFNWNVLTQSYDLDESAEMIKNGQGYYHDAIQNLFKEDAKAMQDAAKNLALKIGSNEITQQDWLSFLSLYTDDSQTAEELKIAIESYLKTGESGKLSKSTQEIFNSILPAIDSGYTKGLRDRSAAYLDLALKSIQGTLTSDEQNILDEYGEDGVLAEKYKGLQETLKSSAISTVNKYGVLINSLINDENLDWNDIREQVRAAYLGTFEALAADRSGYGQDAEVAGLGAEIQEAKGQFSNELLADIFTYLQENANANIDTGILTQYLNWDSQLNSWVLKAGASIEEVANALFTEAESQIKTDFINSMRAGAVERRIKLENMETSFADTFAEIYTNTAETTVEQLQEFYDSIMGEGAFARDLTPEQWDALIKGQEDSKDEIIKNILQAILDGAAAAGAEIDEEEVRAKIADLQRTVMQNIMNNLQAALNGTISAVDLKSLGEQLNLDLSDKVVATYEGYKLTEQGFLEVGAAIADQFGYGYDVAEELVELVVGEGGLYGGYKDIERAMEDMVDTNGKIKSGYEDQYALLQNMASISRQMATDETFDFMNQDPTDGMTENADAFINSIQSVKSAFASLKSGESIDYKDFYNMMDFMYNNIPLKEGKTQWQNLAETLGVATDAFESYEDFVNAAVSASDEFGAVNMEGLENIGLSMDGLVEGMSSGLQAVAKEQIRYLEGIKQMLLAMKALEELEDLDLSLDFTELFGTKGDFALDTLGEDFERLNKQIEEISETPEDFAENTTTALRIIKEKTEDIFSEVKGSFDSVFKDTPFEEYFNNLDFGSFFESLVGDFEWTQEDMDAISNFAKFPQYISDLSEAGDVNKIIAIATQLKNIVESGGDLGSYFATFNPDNIQITVPFETLEKIKKELQTQLGLGLGAITVEDTGKGSVTIDFGDNVNFNTELNSGDKEKALEAVKASFAAQGYDLNGMEFEVKDSQIVAHFINPQIKAEVTELGQSLGEEFQAQFENDVFTGYQGTFETDIGEVTIKVSATGQYDITFPEGLGRDDINAWLKEHGFKELTEDQTIDGGKVTVEKEVTMSLEQAGQSIAEQISALTKAFVGEDGKPVPLTLTADTEGLSGAQSIISSIVDAIEGLQGQSITINVDTASAMAQINTLREQINSMFSGGLFTAGEASQNGQSTDPTAQKSGGKTLTIDVKYNKTEEPEDLIKDLEQIIAMHYDKSGLDWSPAHLIQVVTLKYNYSDLKVNLPDLSQTVNLKYNDTGGKTGKTDKGGSGGKYTSGKITSDATGNVNGIALAEGNIQDKLLAGASLAHKTLVGELGPEMAVYGGRYHILGAHGAEFVDLPSNAIVFNHKQTEGIINGQWGYRGTALAEGNFTGPAAASGIDAAIAAVDRAIAVWQSILNSTTSDLLGSSGSGGGGGGGGGGSPGSGETLKAVTEELEEWYNLSRQIAFLEQEINNIIAERENIVDGSEYLRSLREEQMLLKEQMAIQNSLLDYQELQLKRQAEHINTHRIWSQYLVVDESGLLQYRKGNELNGGKGALEVLQELNEMGINEQLSFLNSIGYSYVDNDGYFLEGEELVQKFFDEIQEQIDSYDTLYDTVHQTEETIENLISSIEEINQQIKENQMDLEEAIYDIIVSAWEANIEQMEEQVDLIKEANEAYIKGLEEALDTEKEMYSTNQSIEEREALQRQLALLRRSGGSASEIANLEEQLDAALRDEYFNKQQQMIENIQDANEEQVRKLEEQIRLQQEALEYQKETGVIWQQVYEVMAQEKDAILDFMTGNSVEFFTQSTLQQEAMLTDWAKKIGIFTENREYQNHYDYVMNTEWDPGQVWENEKLSAYKNTFDALSGEAQLAIQKQFGSVYSNARLAGDDHDIALQKAIDAILKTLQDRKAAADAALNQAPTTGGLEGSYRPDESAGGGSSGGGSYDGGGYSGGSSGGSYGGSYGSSSSDKKYYVYKGGDSRKYGPYSLSEAQSIARNHTQSTGYESLVIADDGYNERFPKNDYSNKTTTSSNSSVSANYDPNGGFNASGYNYETGTYTPPSSSSSSSTSAKQGWHYILWNNGVEKYRSPQAYSTQSEAQRIAKTKLSAYGAKSYTTKWYNQGGLVDYTGLAMVHGSQTKPESFLNADQTAQIREALLATGSNGALSALRSAAASLANAASSISNNDSHNISISEGAIQVSVGSLASSYDVDELADDIMNKMVSIASKTTNRGVNRR